MNIDEYDYSSQDRKILTWNKENYEEFVQSFTIKTAGSVALPAVV